MNQGILETNNAYVDSLAQKAMAASRSLRTVSAQNKDAALHAMAQGLRAQTAGILEANQLDLQQATAQGLSKAMIDRLTLTPARIEAMATGVEEIAGFPSPLGRILEQRTLANGIALSRVAVPIGSILFIYESRPNVTVDGAALCLKSGNSVILRGGKESLHSSSALAQVIRDCLQNSGIDPDAVQLVNTTDREVVNLLLKRDDALDLVIPRGGEGLIRTVVESSRIPVIKHYKGVCHIYVHASADLAQAPAILENAKVQRPSACNAMETLLLDATLGPDIWRQLVLVLQNKGVVVHGCERSVHAIAGVKPLVNQEQYHTEYLDLQCSLRIVDGLQQAMDHVETYSSRHTDAILAQDQLACETWVAGVDSSSVMVNTSTRFADGGQYGLGAEVGISTDKLHARGPMGVESLCSYKWVLQGDGQVRGNV